MPARMPPPGRPSGRPAAPAGARPGRTATPGKSAHRRPNAARSWAWSTIALIVLAVVIIGFSWPFAGIFKPVLVLVAIFTFARKILRRVFGSGTRRGRWM
jgi:cobalamin synthase